MGRPSIDPVTFFKLHLIMFFEGIRSERQHMEMVNLKVRRKSEQVLVYIADPSICNTCPVKQACIASNSGRHIFHSYFQDLLDRAARYRATDSYQKALRKRQVWVEPLFGEGKQWHGMRHFRLRGLEKVNIEGLLRAAGQNMKRLSKERTWRNPFKPAGSAALRIAFEQAFCPL